MKEFDFEKFRNELYSHKNRIEQDDNRNISFEDIGTDSGVGNRQTVFRAFRGHGIDLKNVILLCDWMNKTVDFFIK